MNKFQILLFCAISLVLSLGTAAVLYPQATISQQQLDYVRTPQPMEALPDVDLGPDFGQVPVTELVGYYIDNPPAPVAAGVQVHQQQFGGC